MATRPVLRSAQDAEPDANTPAVEQSNAGEVFLNGVAEFWPLWVLLGAVLVVRASLVVWGWARLKRSGIEEIDQMDGRTFERRLAMLFRRLGYHVEHVGRRGDYGADLLVRRDGKRTVVQAKRWTKNVGIRAVQEAHAAPALYGCSGAMVVTNRYYTEAAKKLARANGVVLWDRDRLAKALLAVRNS
jgi:restriction system protein